MRLSRSGAVARYLSRAGAIERYIADRARPAIETYHLPGRHDQKDHGRRGRRRRGGDGDRDSSGRGGGRGGRSRPMTDEEFEARQRHVESTMDRAYRTSATDLTHARDGAWDEERDRLHREIADELYARAADVPNEGRAVIAGGLGGAGKTTVLRDHAGIDPGGYLTINPDDIKEEMARRGLVPDVPGAGDLSPMERSNLVHEESSRIAKLLANKAYADRKNMIWDITMSSESSVAGRLEALDAAGYGQVTGVFVDIPVDTSVRRALSRYRRGQNRWAVDGEGLGGRYVPPDIIRRQRSRSGSQSLNRDVFAALTPRFTDWAVYDNSVDGRNPQLVAEGGGGRGREGGAGG